MILALGFYMSTACDRFLDEKPDASITTPETLQDLRALLDHENNINRHYPGLVEMGTDDFFLDYNIFGSLPNFDQDVYTWAESPQYLPADLTHWTNTYIAVMTANIVLEGLERIADGSQASRDQLRGEALFVRGYTFFYLSQVYCAPYVPNGDNGGPGIPLRLTSDFNVASERATVDETYGQILLDLHMAAMLLPDEVEHKTRASKAAAYAALAKVYLAIEDYQNALIMAQEALRRYDRLMDYNDLAMGGQYTFAPMHEETIYYAFTSSANRLLLQARANIAAELYAQYEPDDLRREAYYFERSNGRIGFRGNYTGNNSSYFAGLATDELYLVQAECLARAGDLGEALSSLNQLLEKRWRTGTFVPYSATDATSVLQLILDERRKSLVLRGVRWSDLRRLNRDERFEKTLWREVNNGSTIESFSLPPNDLRYTYLIPQEVVALTGMPQNER